MFTRTCIPVALLLVLLLLMALFGCRAFEPQVSVDDRKDQENPALRLGFLRDELADPVITFRARRGDQLVFSAFADSDTIGYGVPFTIAWAGSTANVRPYNRELLARLDTVPPVDGLYGYKYRVLAEDCDDATEDCWHPRRFNHALGESLSTFGWIDSLRFGNDDSSPNIFGRRLASGVHRLLLVNTIDVAGREVPLSERELNVVSNYDPETRLLRGQTDPFYEDPHVYPYTRVFIGQQVIEEYTFAEGDTVPDRSYVVFKAVGRDDPRDVLLGLEGFGVSFQGAFTALGLFEGIGPYHFAAPYGEPSLTPQWQATEPWGWSADTLGFSVGPFAYTFTMRTVDEHGRRDGTADSFQFHGNFPPCVQCVELLNWTEPSQYSFDDECYSSECATAVDTMVASLTPNPGYRLARSFGFGRFYYRLQTGEVWFQRPWDLAGVDSVEGSSYGYRLLLHGKDHPLEPPPTPCDRILSWRYQIVSQNDPENAVRDGAGPDDLQIPLEEFSIDPDSLVYVDQDGVWILTVKFFVPFILQLVGPQAYWDDLFNRYQDSALADQAFALTTLQLGETQATVIARDASSCVFQEDNGEYKYFRGVRQPAGCPLRQCGVDCENLAGAIELVHFAAQSDAFLKHYVLRVLISSTGELYP
jgi:hypothetical protein